MYRVASVNLKKWKLENTENSEMQTRGASATSILIVWDSSTPETLKFSLCRVIIMISVFSMCLV